MKARIVWNIANMAFDGKAKIDLTFEKMQIVITNAEEEKEKLYSPNILKGFGSLIERKGKEVVGIGEVDFSGLSIISTQDFEKAYFNKLVQCTLIVETFIQSLWFCKDNSVGVLGCYSEIEDLNHMISKGASVVNYNVAGKVETTVFSKDDILVASKVHESLAKIMPQKEYTVFDGVLDIVTPETNSVNRKQLILPKAPLNFSHNDQNRIERAFMFLHIARNHSYVLYRLVFYVPILECLFGDSNSNSEITHKVAERVAFYIGENAQERYELFNAVRDAYGIRSRFIHGDVFDKNSIKKVGELSPQIDNVTRKILLRIILEDSEIFLNDERRTEYLKKIVFQF